MKFKSKARNSRIKYPIATVIPYGPDDRTVTKLVASVSYAEDRDDDGPMELWVGTSVASDPAVARKMYLFMKSHGVKTVVTAPAILGCPHEEGPDFPSGGDCPFCPFWKGKQGSGTDDSRWDAVQYVRVERLASSYRFWLPGL